MASDPRVDLLLACELHRSLGVELLDPVDPPAGARFPVRGLACTPMGTLHAAALGAVMEVAAYLAVLPKLARTEQIATHAFSLQLFRAARMDDTVQVSGRLSRRSRNLAFVAVTATIRAQTIAEAQITKSVIEL